jgi:hypothetical protein
MTESENQPDPERRRLLRSIFEPSSLDEVAEAVSVATEDERQIYVERIGYLWRWSLTHPGGAYPLLRITARFLRRDYHGLVIGFRAVADGVFILAGDPATDQDPDAWTVLEFDRPAEPSDVRCRIEHALGVNPQAQDRSPADALYGQNEIRLWLDDDVVDRAAPQGWVHVTTAKEVIALLDKETVVELSLDHDLGDDERFGRGIDVVDWLAEQQEVHGRSLWPRDGIIIHSANPAGRDAMVRAIEHYAARTVEVRRSLTRSGKPRLTFSQK